MGAKTTTSHSVMATAASPISILPRTAAVRGVFAEQDVPVHVFQDHDGVIHEDADAQPQGHEAHDVQREMKRVHGEERADQGKGDGNENDEGGAPPAEEKEKHQGGRDDAFQQVQPGLIQGRGR